MLSLCPVCRILVNGSERFERMGTEVNDWARENEVQVPFSLSRVRFQQCACLWIHLSP